MAATTHRKIFWVSLVIAAVAAVVVLTSLAGMTPRAQSQEPTPSPTELAPPAAPELTGIDDGVTWIDNSDNEDGFRVYITVDGREHVFEVGPDITVFEYPEGLLPICGDTRYRLSAFNEAGETSSSRWGRIAECPGWGSTPQPEILPETGSGQGVDAFPYALVLAALAGAAGLTLISAASLILRRR